MKKGLSELIYILDKSGSMWSLADDTIGGFNSMIESQKEVEGEANVTLVCFNHEYSKIYDNIPLNEVTKLTNKEYQPNGSTALYDAVGRTIAEVGKRLHNTPEEERPEKVIVTITTDGYENASKEYTHTMIKDMITHQQEKYNWTFIFLGADIGSVQEATSWGIKDDFTSTWTTSSAGLDNYSKNLSNAVSQLRMVDNLNENIEAYNNISASIKAINID